MSVQEVVVEYKDPNDDLRAKALIHDFPENAHLTVDQLRTADVYYLEGVDDVAARGIAEGLLANPITQSYELNPNRGSERIIVGYLPAVTNPASATLIEAAAALGYQLEAIEVATEYRFPDKSGVFLMNRVVQQLIKEKPESLRVVADTEQSVEGDTWRVRRAQEGDIRSLMDDYKFSEPREVEAIRDYFAGLGRDPTEVEMRIISGWWSEHCGHKTFRSKLEVDGQEKKPLYTRIRETAGEFFEEGDVISAFKDNSGVVSFYDGWAICIKGETHNYPSKIVPFAGAATGVGGIIRDIFGTGRVAKVIAMCDILNFARWDQDPKTLPEYCLPADYTQKEVIAGISDYGNKFGVPTSNGSIHYHQDFGPSPTVMIVSAGILPEERAQKEEPRVGDLVVVIGGKTGRDGIGGATHSSVLLDTNDKKAGYSAVQIGNPIEEKRMADASLELAERGLIVALNDCGAAGFSSAIGELGKNVGVTIDLSKAPLKYQGMQPWEIMMSESQERMALAVDPNNLDQVREICRKYNVEATVFGHFDGSRKLNVWYGDRREAELDYSFLEDGLPQKVLEASWEKPVFDDRAPDTPTDWAGVLKQVLSHGNVCSKQPVITRYDHGVQGASVLYPYLGKNLDAPSDASVLQPLPDKPYGVVIAQGSNPILNRIDPYFGTLWAAAESLANAVAVGADPAAVCFNENFVSPYPTKQYLGSLDRQVDAVVDFMRAFRRPVVSGKDSLSSTYRNFQTKQVIDIPPVVNIATMGKIPNVEKTVTSDIKGNGSVLCLVGQLDQGLGGSTFYDIHGLVGNEVPKIDLEMLPQVFNKVSSAIQSGKVMACHDVSEGGVIGAVAEMCFGGDCGIDLELDLGGARPENFLFNETAGSFVVEIKDLDTARSLFGDVPMRVLGKTKTEKNLAVSVDGQSLFTADIDELKKAWKTPLGEVFS